MAIENTLLLIWRTMLYNSNEAKCYFPVLGLILLVAYPLFYFFNVLFISDLYESPILRAIAAAFGMLLLLFRYWPEWLKKITPVVFYVILFFSFPFFFSYMLFQEPECNIWQINELTGLVLLTIFVDWISFVILTLLGVGVAFIIVASSDLSIYSHLISIFGSYSSPLICLLIFTKQRRNLQNERFIYAEQMQKANEFLELRVVERTKELQKAINFKTAFLNNISHEIRTPIQAFTVMSEGLVTHWDEFDESRKLTLAKQVSNSAKRLQNLLNSLLDLSKFMAGKMFLDLKQIDLEVVIEDVIEGCKILYLEKKDIIFSIKISQILLIGDHERIAQVLRNLIFNAIKFSNDKDIIKIKAEVIELPIKLNAKSTLESEALRANVVNMRHGKYIYIAISDSGIGIPQDELKEIFAPFVQSSRTNNGAGGTGLGLAIVKQIIAAHKGRVWAFNNICGATFAFVIPQK